MKSTPTGILFLALSLYAYQGIAQSDHKKIDTYIRHHLDEAKIIGLQVASIGEGELIWQGSYGVKEYQGQDSINDSTLFMMASCSKPVTSLGIMKLYDQGKLDLDDDINDYLPFRISNPHHSGEPISFRMLLTHTSSLRDNWDVLDPLYTLPEGGDSPLELQSYVQDYFTEGGAYYFSAENFAEEKPGTGFSYCNMGYSLLGLLIEQISGKSFSQYMQEDIFRPLGMKHSYWFLQEIPHDNIARPHEIAPEKEPQALNHYGFASFPDGQLRTTATDYAQVLKLMINRGKVNGSRFLSENTVDEYLEIPYPEVAKHQALAWNYNEFNAFSYILFMPRYLFTRKIPAHSGYDPGVETYVAFDPKKKRGIIIFINSPLIEWKGVRIYHVIIKKLFKEAKHSS